MKKLNKKMKVENVWQQGNTLQATFSVTCPAQSFVSKYSPEYIISGLAVFQVNMDITHVLINTPSINIRNAYIYIKFIKLLQEDNLTYTIKLSSTGLKIVNKKYISDDGTWHLIWDSADYDIIMMSSFDVTVQMDTVLSASPFALLHEDTELTNFELRGEDGSVHVHRAVLAAASPVLRCMLTGTWLEATEGRVEVPGTSKVTLQNLKDYVYLHTLPDNGLKPLLRIALCYMMKDLEQNCIFKIVSSVTAENACDWLEYATAYKVPLLLRLILECVKNENLKVDDLCKHLISSK